MRSLDCCLASRAGNAELLLNWARNLGLLDMLVPDAAVQQRLKSLHYSKGTCIVEWRTGTKE